MDTSSATPVSTKPMLSRYSLKTQHTYKYTIQCCFEGICYLNCNKVACNQIEYELQQEIRKTCVPYFDIGLWAWPFVSMPSRCRKKTFLSSSTLALRLELDFADWKNDCWEEERQINLIYSRERSGNPHHRDLSRIVSLFRQQTYCKWLLWMLIIHHYQ